MNKIGLVTLTALAAAFLVMASSPAATPGGTARKTKGGGIYYLVAPPGAGPRKPCPLLVAIHGDGYDAKTFQGDWSQYAAKAGYILALPEKANSANPGWSTTDIDNIKEMIAEVRAKYAVPARLTAVAGHSSGSAVALDIALAEQSAVSVVVSIAGNMNPTGKELKKSKKFGVFIMHGTADTIVPVSTARKAADALKKAGFEVTIREVQGHRHATPFPSAPMNEAMKFAAVYFKTKARLVEKPGAEGVLPWSETEGALEELKKGGKPGLVYAYAKTDAARAHAAFLEWDLFPSDEFREIAKEFILIRVDRDADKELAKKLKLRKCTLMAVDKDLKKLKSYTRPASIKKLLKDLRKILKKYKK